MNYSELENLIERSLHELVGSFTADNAVYCHQVSDNPDDIKYQMPSNMDHDARLYLYKNMPVWVVGLSYELYEQSYKLLEETGLDVDGMLLLNHNSFDTKSWISHYEDKLKEWLKEYPEQYEVSKAKLDKYCTKLGKIQRFGRIRKLFYPHERRSRQYHDEVKYAHNEIEYLDRKTSNLRNNISLLHRLEERFGSKLAVIFYYSRDAHIDPADHRKNNRCYGSLKGSVDLTQEIMALPQDDLIYFLRSVSDRAQYKYDYVYWHEYPPEGVHFFDSVKSVRIKDCVRNS
jgi:hypothetical protein